MAKKTKKWTYTESRTTEYSSDKTKGGAQTYDLPSDFTSLISASHSGKVSNGKITFQAPSGKAMTSEYAYSKREEKYTKIKDGYYKTIKGSSTQYTSPDGLSSDQSSLDEEVWVPPEYGFKKVSVSYYRHTYTTTFTLTYDANTAPTQPDTIQTSSELRTEKPVTINWGSATDNEGDTVNYTLSVSYGGSNTWTTLYTGTQTTFQYNMPTGVASVQYRVQSSDGKSTSDWKTTDVLPVTSNAAPTISGEDKTIKTAGNAVTYEYTVSDQDGDPVEVIETLNGRQIKKLTNAPLDHTIVAEVSADHVRDLPLGADNVLMIQATDTKQQSAFRRIIIEKTNASPVFESFGALNPMDINEWHKNPSVAIKVSDPDGETVHVKAFLNSALVDERDVTEESGEYTFTFTPEQWVSIKPDVEHALSFEATDPQGALAKKTLRFMRKVDRIEIKARYTSDQFTEVVSHLFVTIQWMLDQGVNPTVFMCNNALDENPTWEDVTSNVMQKTDILLSNATKTAAEWAIGIHVTIERGTSDGPSWLGSIGGVVKEG